MKNLIRPYFLDQDGHDAVLIIPGGGYAYHSQREGEPVARLFNQRGFHAGVFEYRHELLLYPQIVAEAKRLVSEFRNQKLIKRLFVIGFSAGGHLALMLLEGVPNFFSGGVLAYPVVSTKPGLIHEQSFINLFGRTPDPQELEEVSLEDHLVGDMPPLFLWHTLSDKSVNPANSLALLEASAKQNLKIEAHFYDRGEHGLSIITEATAFQGKDPKKYVEENKHVSLWVEAMFQWINSI
ncbi:MAG: alpha/beta hydrolase [Candidatus Izemoplasmatales bacterium]|jgi:acetyl esterase/lipase